LNDPEFKLDGNKLPTPAKDGYIVTHNRIWSSNAGRNSSTGRFVGDIIAVKYTVKLNYEMLSDEQMQVLWNASSGIEPWHDLEFPLTSGAVHTITCYIADVTYTMRRFDTKQKKAFYSGVVVEFIEQ